MNYHDSEVQHICTDKPPSTIVLISEVDDWRTCYNSLVS